MTITITDETLSGDVLNKIELAPRILRKRIRKKLGNAYEKYQESTEE